MKIVFTSDKTLFIAQVEVEVVLQLMVSQSVCLGIEHPCGTCDQILLPVEMLLSEICSLEGGQVELAHGREMGVQVLQFVDMSEKDVQRYDT
jgi:hypothetical protein